MLSFFYNELWLFQILCDLLERHGEDLHFAQLMTKLRSEFKRLPINFDKRLAMQTPIVHDALSKNLYLKKVV